MKRLKKVILSTMVILLCLSCVVSNAEELKNDPVPLYYKERLGTTVPINLKIDIYHILYTPPYGPYVNKDYRLMIPATATKYLMGAEVDYDQGSEFATIKILGVELSYTNNSNIILVNGKEKQMNTQPEMKENILMIPVKSILDNTDITYEYDAQYKQLHITDKRAKGNIYDSFEGNNLPSKNDNAIKLPYYKLYPKQVNGEYERMDFYGINMLDKTITYANGEFQGELRIISQYPNGGFSDNGNYSKRAPYFRDIPPGILKQIYRVKFGGMDYESKAYWYMTARLQPF